MISNLFVILTLLSALMFPWPLTAALALGTAIFEPWLPLAAGIFIDTVYYVPPGVPYFALIGLLVTLIAFFVRTRLKTSIIGE